MSSFPVLLVEDKDSLRAMLRHALEAQGHTVLDVGTHSSDSVDYPDFALAVSRAVAGGEAARGLLVCGTGIGMAITANKVPGIRAAVCGDAETARLSRQHNDLNVLAMAGRATSPAAAIGIVRVWLETPFEGGRHERRLGPGHVRGIRSRVRDGSRLLLLLVRRRRVLRRPVHRRRRCVHGERGVLRRCLHERRVRPAQRRLSHVGKSV